MTVLKVMIKIIISLTLITGLIFLVGWRGLAEQWQTVPWAQMIIPVCFFIANISMLAWRFHWVLLNIDVKLKGSLALRIQLMGLTINQFLPGLFGGDVLRATYLMPAYPDKKSLLTAVVIFERLNGLLAMLAIGILGSFYLMLSKGEIRWLLISATAAIVLISLLLFVARVNPKSGLPEKIQRWLNIGQDVKKDVIGLFNHPQLFRFTFYFSCIAQLLMIFVYWYLLQIMNSTLPFLSVAVVVALSWLMTLIPVSLNGLGIRESGLTVGMMSLGVSKEIALTASFLGLIPMVMAAAIGGLVLAFHVEELAKLKDIKIREA